MPGIFEEQQEASEAGEVSSTVGEEVRSVDRKGVDQQNLVGHCRTF